MTRDEATRQIVAARQEKMLSWQELAKRVGRHPVWTTAALLGQHAMSADEAQAATSALGLGSDVAAALQECPMPSAGSDGPHDLPPV
jgi:cyanate lyase